MLLRNPDRPYGFRKSKECAAEASAHRSTPQVVLACVRHGGRGRFRRHPARRTHPPEDARALEAHGLGTSKEQPQLHTHDPVDIAITLGRGEECPYAPGVKCLDAPGGQDDVSVRRIIGDLDTRVRELLVELVPDIDLPASVLTEHE